MGMATPHSLGREGNPSEWKVLEINNQSIICTCSDADKEAKE